MCSLLLCEQTLRPSVWGLFIGKRTFEHAGISLARTKQLTWGVNVIFRYLLGSHVKKKKKSPKSQRSQRAQAGWRYRRDREQISTPDEEEPPSNANSPKMELTNLCDNEFSVLLRWLSQGWRIVCQGCFCTENYRTALRVEWACALKLTSWNSSLLLKSKLFHLNFFTLPSLFSVLLFISVLHLSFCSHIGS